MSDTPLIEASHEGAVTTLRLARPEKRNALSDPMIAALREQFASLPDTTKAVVIYGEGEHFCSGLDLSEVKERDAVEGVFHSRSWHACFNEIQFGRVPVVSAMHGAVVGGGLELALTCHIRVADTTTFYALPEGSRGIFVGGGGAVRIPRVIGVSRMTDMMLTGRSMNAEEGYALALSQYLVPAGESLAKATAIAKRVAENATMTNYAIMHALPRIASMNHDDGLLAESLMASIAQSAPEAKARLRDFLEGRANKVKRPD